MKNNKELNTIVKILEDHKAENVQTVDVRGKSPFADYCVIATAPNERALGAYTETLPDALEEQGIKIRAVEGRPATEWVIIDTFDCLIHLFLETKRNEVSLEEVLLKN